MKLLVPNSTAGMIIGKAGNFIRQIKEESGAYVQISQKSKEMSLPERCVTIAGENGKRLFITFLDFHILLMNLYVVNDETRWNKTRTVAD